MRSCGQFCPVAKASEVLAERWSLLADREILAERWSLLADRELLAGSHRFNELHHGVLLMSPTLLAKRLGELQRADIVEHRPLEVGRGICYDLTPAGDELRPVVPRLGAWGDRWVNHRIGPGDRDPALLMWDVRRRVDTAGLPARSAVVRFMFREAPSGRRWWWLVVDDDDVDLCVTDPARDVDLTVRTSVRAMTRVWVGHLAIEDALSSDQVALDGSAALARSFPRWIGVPDRAGEREDVLRASLGPSGDHRNSRVTYP